jgi:50S ribosomal protein L16 3-hydroxylase
MNEPDASCPGRDRHAKCTGFAKMNDSGHLNSGGLDGPSTRSCIYLIERTHEVKNFHGVASRIDAVERMAHASFFIDDEDGAKHAAATLAVGLALLPDAVFARHFAIGIGKQGYGYPMGIAKIRVAQAIVGADADHHAIDARKILVVIGKIGGLLGADRRAIARVEKQDHRFLAAELRQIHGCHVGIGQREQRCRLTGVQLGIHVRSFRSASFGENINARLIANFRQTIIPAMKMQLLGGLTAAQFLERHWQKRPLLVRGAIPGFRDPLTPREIRRLAGSSEVESRLVWRSREKWHLEHGPIPASRFARMPATNWTALVQGINLQSDPADALLRRFNFIPAARLDDLMASIAAPGGGVGAHVDSYDVFLLQGQGRRRWRISRQSDHRLVKGAPLAVLDRFRAEEEWILEPGDMLYLPPHVAHEGVALDACTTWSIGFRAPAARELGAALLDRLDQSLHAHSQPARYRDVHLAPSDKTGRIPRSMLDYAGKIAGSLKLDNATIESALGQCLTEPKAMVAFDPPDPALTKRAFGASLRTRGLRLDRRTQLLYLGGNFHINGDQQKARGADAGLLRALSDRRQLAPMAKVSRAAHEILYRWYVYGWLHPDNRD